MPSEPLLLRAVHTDHNLRRRLCSPLSKRMGHLKELKTACAGGVDPALQPGEIERICSISVVNFQQLGSGPFPSDRGIQRNAPERSVKNIVAVSGHVAEILLQQLPEPLRPTGNMVTDGDAVRIKPVDGKQFLFRKPERQNTDPDGGPVFHFRLFPDQQILRRHDTERNLVFARLHLFRNADRAPESMPVAAGKTHPVVFQRQKRIGKQSGRMGQHIRIVRHGRQYAGNQSDFPERKRLAERRFRFKFDDQILPGPARELKRNGLPARSADGVKPFRRKIGRTEYFFKRTYKPGGKKHGFLLLDLL